MMAMSRTIRDHLGRRIDLADRPQRIVSLCPSLTETLFALGLAVVGRTCHCIRPGDAVVKVPVVGGAKTLSLEAIAALAPDLVIAGKEENDRAQVEALMERHPVFVIEVNDFEGALRAVRDLGETTGARREAAALVKRINSAFEDLSPLEAPMSAAYLIWAEPYMAAGQGTFISAMLARCGLRNVCASQEERYPELSVERIAALAPQALLLSTEPFPFTAAHVREWGQRMPESEILLVDGEMFAWYGARMVEAAAYLGALVKRLASPAKGSADS
jgi:iron complex transport system substrate-binding protein